MKRKIRKLRGGGMDASKKDFKTPSVNKTVNVSNGSNNTTTTSKIGPVVKDVPFVKPLSTTESFIAGLVVPFSGTLVNMAAKMNYKGRQKFARKKGLYRDQYKTTGTVLQPNSPGGKKYLKDAGYGGTRPVVPLDDGQGGDNYKKIIPVEQTKPVDQYLVKPKDNFFNFVAYNVGGLSGGVKYGPPPKKGPNAQVPPIKLKRGSKK